MNSFKLQGLAFSLSNVDNSNSLFIVKEFIPNKETFVFIWNKEHQFGTINYLINFQFRIAKFEVITLSRINYIYSVVNGFSGSKSSISLFGRKFDYVISDNLDYLLNKKQTLDLFK